MNIYALANAPTGIGQRPYGHRPTPLQAFADAPVFMKICDDF